MSLLRRQILPIFGAGMTLAVGVALGAGPLQGDDGPDGSGDLSAENAKLSDQVASLQAGQAFSETAAAGLVPGVVEDALSGRTVTLIVFPGVPDERADGIRAAVKAAGGSTAVTAELSAELLDPGKKTYVSSVAASSLDGARDVAKAVGDDPYEQIGALIGRAYLAHGDSVVIDDEATKIDSEIQGAKLVTVSGEPAQRGSLLIVLGPGVHGSDVAAQAQQLISTAMVEAWSAAGDGSVVVTPSTGAAPGGLIDTLAADADLADLKISTLDIADGSFAQAAAILSLAASANDKAGAYGADSGDGGEVVLPPGMPSAPAE